MLDPRVARRMLGGLQVTNGSPGAKGGSATWHQKFAPLIKALGSIVTPATGSPTLAERKAVLGKEIANAQEVVDGELVQARRDIIVVVVLGAVTVVTAAGAAIFSNPWGTLTTAVAGVSGTGGMAMSVKSSFVSYGSLRVKRNAEIATMQNHLAAANDPKGCDDLQTEIDRFLEEIEKAANTPPS